MATVAVGSRGSLVARSTADRVLLREYLERDRLFAAYAICDLGEREFPRTRWGIATVGERPVAVALEYGGLTPQPLFVMGEPDGIAAILHDIVRPRAAYVAAKRESLPAVAQHYRVEPGPEMIRMWVDRSTFQPTMARTERLVPVEVGELNRLYQLGFAAWLPATAVAEGVYYGIRINGRLVAAAGTHVINRDAGLAVVGNVLTQADYRGRGYAKAVTSAVTAGAPALVRRGRAQRPSRQPARDRRLPPRSATRSTAGSRSASSAARPRPGRTSRRRSGACSAVAPPPTILPLRDQAHPVNPPMARPVGPPMADPATEDPT